MDEDSTGPSWLFSHWGDMIRRRRWEENHSVLGSRAQCSGASDTELTSWFYHLLLLRPCFIHYCSACSFSRSLSLSFSFSLSLSQYENIFKLRITLSKDCPISLLPCKTKLLKGVVSTRHLHFLISCFAQVPLKQRLIWLARGSCFL